MSPTQDPNIQQPTKQKKPLTSRGVFFLVLIVIIVVGGITLYVSNKDKQNKPATSNTPTNSSSNSQEVKKTAKLYFDPSQFGLVKGQTVSLAVMVDTGGQAVNAVQADLTYPTTTFDFVSIDDTGSAFSVAAPSSGGDGKVTIARGQIGDVTGKQLVVHVKLKVKDDTGSGDVTFSSTSAVMNSKNSVDVLASTDKAHFEGTK